MTTASYLNVSEDDNTAQTISNRNISMPFHGYFSGDLSSSCSNWMYHCSNMLLLLAIAAHEFFKMATPYLSIEYRDMFIDAHIIQTHLHLYHLMKSRIFRRIAFFLKVNNSFIHKEDDLVLL